MSKRKHGDLDWSLADANPIQALIQPENVETFLTKVWEKCPKLYKADSFRKELLPTISSLSFLKGLLDPANENNTLIFGEDLNAARYVNGERETPNGKDGDLKTVMALYNDGCTIQLHQPQRWNDNLWRLIAALEKQLGCLVGANAYITPKGTQGLAPHYDDVDLWVCQTEGSKRWQIFKSPEGCDLPAVPSLDFKASEIGQPIMDITLEVGDVLFMPRGTVHQAIAQEEASCHVTVSTYQKWALADFAQNLIAVLQRGQPSTQKTKATPLLPRSMRTGLPINFLSPQTLLTGQDEPTPVAISTAAKVAEGLRALAEQLESETKLTSTVADNMAVDFMQCRAPPHPKQLPQMGNPPIHSSQVQSVGSSYFRMMPCSPSPEVAEAYPGESSFVSILSCLSNDITRHMMGPVNHDAIDFLAGDDEASSEDDEEEAQGNGATPDAQRHKSQKGSKLSEEEEEIDLGSQDESDEDEEDDSQSDSEGAGGALVFPESYSKALKQLLFTNKPVAIKDLKLKSKDERLDLTYSLWKEKMVYTVEARQKTKEPVSKKQKS